MLDETQNSKAEQKMGDEARPSKTHSNPEDLFSFPAHHGEIGDEEDERRQSAGI
jgi:hypothetical protein